MRLGVGGGHGADVPALDVGYDRQTQVRCGFDQVRIDFHPRGPETLEERGLQLDGCRVGLDRLQNAPAEFQGRFGLRQTAQLLREAGGNGIQARHQRALLAARSVYK
jgi:hypothetical protein